MIDVHAFSGRMGNEMFRHAFLYAQLREGNIPDLYLQDVSYFEKYGDEIKKMFGQGIGFLPYVGIQLRIAANPLVPDEPRYIDNPFMVSLPKTGYYIDAINQFPGRKFIVFSDDIEFAKSYFEGDKFAFDEGGNEVEVLNRFASCNGHIIANSSFGWWAAYLSPGRGKVVAPSDKLWFADGVKRVGCPQEWIRL